MAWGKAGSTTLTVAGDSYELLITSSKFFQILDHTIPSGTTGQQINFNNDTTTSYALRYSGNGGTDGTGASRSGINHEWDQTRLDRFVMDYWLDISGEETLGISFSAYNDSAGAGTAPSRFEEVWKWDDTSQVSEIDMINPGAGDFAADSNLTVLGSDLTPAAAVPALGANVQAGSRYEETDTRKMYNLSALSFDFSATSTGAVSNQPTDATEVGQLITSTTHQGKKAKSATFYVQRVGSPGGTMVYKIRKSSDNSVVATSTGTSASALSTSKTAVTLNFNDEDIPSENIRVTVSGVTGSSGNLVTIYGGGADTVADQSLSVWGGSSWTEYGNDCAGELTFTEEWQEIGA